MNATLPNVERSAPGKDGTVVRKSVALSEKEERASGFEKVIDKVRDEKKVRENSEATDQRKDANPASSESQSDKSDSKASDALRDLLEKAGAGASVAAGSEDSAVKSDGAADAGAGQRVSGAAELLADELLAMPIVVNAAMTAEQKAGSELSSVTGLANMTGSTALGREGTMAQVLNALSSKELKAVNGEALSGSEAGRVKSPNAGPKPEGNGAINLPQAEGHATGTRQVSTDFLSKQGKPQPDASVSQPGGKPAGGEVKVVSLETHLPPAELGRPAQQVANALSRQLSQTPSAANTAQELAAQAADAKAAKPVKSLEIQLRPDNLGVVRANMQMRGGELEISLVTSTREAADLLKGDLRTLARVLQDGGYRTETQNITVNFKEGVSDQMRQPGQSQERFGGGNGSESGAQQSRDDQPHAQYTGAGLNEAEVQDIRSGIYL